MRFSFRVVQALALIRMAGVIAPACKDFRTGIKPDAGGTGGVNGQPLDAGTDRSIAPDSSTNALDAPSGGGIAGSGGTGTGGIAGGAGGSVAGTGGAAGATGGAGAGTGGRGGGAGSMIAATGGAIGGTGGIGGGTGGGTGGTIAGTGGIVGGTGGMVMGSGGAPVCGSGLSVCNGTCCLTGQACCQGTCVDVTSSAQDCGSTCTICGGSAPRCLAGVCQVCGNGMVESSEFCDDGFQTSCGACNATCTGAGTPSVCGDGVRCLDTEACDDGETLVCGSCNATCTASGMGAACCPSPSPNSLLMNGGFNVGLFPWVVQFPGPQRSTLDATGCSASGSLQTTQSVKPPFQEYVSQCIRVFPGTKYNVGAWVRIAAGSPAADVRVVFQWVQECDSDLAAQPAVTLAAAATPDVWQYLHAENIVPSGDSAYLDTQLHFNKANDAPGTVSAFFDMVYVAVAPDRF